MTIDNIFEEIEKANKIVVLTHEKPEGDAIGSLLAMKLVLEKLGKTVDAIITEIPSTFKFLPGAEQVKSKSNVEQYDLAITLDECSSVCCWYCLRKQVKTNRWR